jgi:hypothetical protein
VSAAGPARHWAIVLVAWDLGPLECSSRYPPAAPAPTSAIRVSIRVTIRVTVRTRSGHHSRPMVSCGRKKGGGGRALGQGERCELCSTCARDRHGARDEVGGGMKGEEVEGRSPLLPRWQVAATTRTITWFLNGTRFSGSSGRSVDACASYITEARLSGCAVKSQPCSDCNEYHCQRRRDEEDKEGGGTRHRNSQFLLMVIHKTFIGDDNQSFPLKNKS